MSFDAMQAAGIVGAIQAVRCGRGREMGIGGTTGVAAVTPKPGIADAFDPPGKPARRRRAPRIGGRAYVWRATEPANPNHGDVEGTCDTRTRR